ncbi:Patatin-like phospholipase [Teratosphaeria destructans]|uniref:Patatin-like phospholipase n=1 Tax=Teratosphaeria destructans TaxID=418781 RepID=A0A9W7SNX0_9PEZI|nr:Patatin-like phospholipase [Teratosphaeria destructans]
MGSHSRDDVDSSDSESGDAPAEECEDDRCAGPQLPIWHCVDCDSSYCRPKKKGRDGVPHEKTNPAVVRRLKEILHPTRATDEIQKLHEDDESTKWFGVTKDYTGRPTFEDYGRYASLMSSISPIESLGNRYPQLVSFIGVTNAGKSTLIKLLVNHDADNAIAENRAMFPSPVVGSVVNDAVPTSGDVHLYADPATHAEQLPILFADCEGFEGGERIPLGARAKKQLLTRDDPSRSGQVHTRTIEWANTEETRQREYAVTALYPRLLYTFSDCVVFVLRNAKTFQSAVLTKLLEWGVAALEKSINQPALPHCIVALNGSDPSVNEKEWDIEFSTQSLLMTVKNALDPVEGVPRFRQLAEHWRSLGKHIYTIEDLILRYYSSFKVIRIPAKPRYMTINEQIGKLHSMIKNNCEDSFRVKRRARMLSNADELNVYLQSGFDHFTQHLDIPFNFMQISLLRNPIPNDFGGHILQLCSTISSRQPTHQPARVAWMFEKLSVMLASCVLLDCARFRKGQVDELFGNYEKFFDYAMGEYLEMHYPCAYVSPDGTRRCELVKARHQTKGHQDQKGIIAAGDYEAAFDATFVEQWKAQLRLAVETVHRDFSYELEMATQTEDMQAIPEERIALDLHIEHLNSFFEQVGPATSICSHATCFCCLMDVPEHPLPCGHVLCTACIKAYGKQSKTSISLSCCPLHREATKWTMPAVVRFKPSGAGVRVLSLDGGGVRGIVQLEVLRAIEVSMGGYLPVQVFFDLIVGTGTGGMIALALSLKDRTVSSCIDMFSAICDHAFTPRMKGVPVVSQIAKIFSNGPRYKTKPLHAALKTAFSKDQDLFGSTDNLRSGARVAITSTSVTERESILLASYRRPDDLVPAYSFERPHEPDMELKMWESAAAALATPNFFKPYNHHAKTYLDGGLRCPNPSFIADRERRLIWPDVDEPDLFLSLGSGQNRITMLQKLSDKPRDSVTSALIPEPGQTAEEARKASGRRRNKRLDDVLDAELAWVDFRSFAVKERSEAKGRRFIRFNPDLDKDPSAPDDKKDMPHLQMTVRRRLQTPHRMAALRNVAHRLIASSFYLDLQAKATAEKSEQVCTGALSCRFEDGSSEMRALGKILESCRTAEFEPYFCVKPDAQDDHLHYEVSVTMDVIRGMTESGVFGIPSIYVPLRDESKPTMITLFLSAHDGLEPDGFPISGFPRILLGKAKQTVEKPRRPVRASSEQLRNPTRQLRGQSGDADAISLNGSIIRHSSDESWQELQTKLAYASANGAPKMSLAELIAQHQGGGGSSIKQRTNRFWTYIGNNHMAQHPEMYSAEDIAKFVVNQGARSSDPPVASIHVTPPGTSASTGSSDTTPREGHDLAPPEQELMRRMEKDLAYQAEIAAASRRYQEHNLQNPTSRHPINSIHENAIEEEDNASTYSGHEVEVQIAKASPVVQVSPILVQRAPSPSPQGRSRSAHTRFRESIDSLIGLHEVPKPSTPTALPALPKARDSPPARGSNGHHSPAKRSLVDDAVLTALPDQSSISALDRWLAAQRGAKTLQKKSSRSSGGLNVVDEEPEEVT